MAIDRTPPGSGRQRAYSPARRLVNETRLLHAHTDYLNALFVLPEDLPINVKRRGFSNMYWDGDSESIAVLLLLGNDEAESIRAGFTRDFGPHLER